MRRKEVEDCCLLRLSFVTTGLSGPRSRLQAVRRYTQVRPIVLISEVVSSEACVYVALVVTCVPRYYPLPFAVSFSLFCCRTLDSCNVIMCVTRNRLEQKYSLVKLESGLSK